MYYHHYKKNNQRRNIESTSCKERLSASSSSVTSWKVRLLFFVVELGDEHVSQQLLGGRSLVGVEVDARV